MIFKNSLVLAHSITTEDAILCQAPKYELNKGDMVIIDTENSKEIAIVELVANVYESSNDIYEVFMKYLEETAYNHEPLPKVVSRMSETMMKYEERKED